MDLSAYIKTDQPAGLPGENLCFSLQSWVQKTGKASGHILVVII